MLPRAAAAALTKTTTTTTTTKRWKSSEMAQSSAAERPARRPAGRAKALLDQLSKIAGVGEGYEKGGGAQAPQGAGVTVTKSVGDGGAEKNLDTAAGRQAAKEGKTLTAACGDVPEEGADEEDEAEMEDMFCDTGMGKEWGGPMRGGRMPEPTRFGDWERKGRCTDF